MHADIAATRNIKYMKNEGGMGNVQAHFFGMQLWTLFVGKPAVIHLGIRMHLLSSCNIDFFL